LTILIIWIKSLQIIITEGVKMPKQLTQEMRVNLCDDLVDRTVLFYQAIVDKPDSPKFRVFAQIVIAIGLCIFSPIVIGYELLKRKNRKI
jgi:hypothetical protein